MPVAEVPELAVPVEAVLLEPLASSCSNDDKVAPVLLYGVLPWVLTVPLLLLLLLLPVLLPELAPELAPELVLDCSAVTLCVPPAAVLLIVLGDGVGAAVDAAPWVCPRAWNKAPKNACNAWVPVCAVLLVPAAAAVLALVAVALAVAAVALVAAVVPDAVSPYWARVCCSALSKVLLPLPVVAVPVVCAALFVDALCNFAAWLADVASGGGDVKPFNKLLVPKVLIDM